MAQKKILKALEGQTLDVPPVWMMRQAGRYLPEYRTTRAKAGDFLSLCYSPEWATEVTLQPIRRFGFDAAILFADILLIPQALGLDLWFVQGEGPRLSTIETNKDLQKLGKIESIHTTLSPVYETVSRLSKALPDDVTLIGFAGAPWTVATYMIAGRGTPDQGPAHNLMQTNTSVFEGLMERIVDATALYLIEQIKAGAEVIKIFDSWAGSLSPDDFNKYSKQPTEEIIRRVHKECGSVPIICFPKGANQAGYESFANMNGVSCLALGQDMDTDWAAKNLQSKVCLQGNLDPSHMVNGGTALVDAVNNICDSLANGPHIFNLGHGITPDADPNNVQLMIDTVRARSNR